MGATKERVKRPPKTIKEKIFVDNYIKTGSPHAAALAAYNVSDKNASALAYTTLKKLDISTIFEKAGLTDDAIAQTLRDAMGALRGKDMPDWLPRLKATEMALKVKGHFKERIEHSGSVGVYPILGGASKGTTIDLSLIHI